MVEKRQQLSFLCTKKLALVFYQYQKVYTHSLSFLFAILLVNLIARRYPDQSDKACHQCIGNQLQHVHYYQSSTGAY